MTAASDPIGTPAREVKVVRMFDASPERVWEAWTKPGQFARWFGTPPFVTPPASVAMDVKPGGEWRATQVSQVDGTQLPFVGTYREVIEPGLLVMTFENPQDRSDPHVEVLTVSFHAVDDKTEVVLEQVGYMPEEQYPLLERGYGGFFDQLESYLTSD